MSETKSNDDLSYLMEQGVPLDKIQKMEREGITLAEMSLAVKAAVKNNEWPDPSVVTAIYDPPDIASCFRPLVDIPEEKASWLIPDWIPEGQITILAADGGCGKTSIWCSIVAALSSGTRCILDPKKYTRDPVQVMFLSNEDSVRKKMVRKLLNAGANANNVIAPDAGCFSDRRKLLQSLKFGSRELERLILGSACKLFVFDPIQSFIPPNLNMGSRNAMRDCLSPLIELGEETGATFLIVAHTNKRECSSGRNRISDSADLWDIARSVIMVGNTGEPNIHYLSNEKNNYAALQETHLFSIDSEGRIIDRGISLKRDRDYQREAQYASAPKREDCEQWIVGHLEDAGGDMLSTRLEADAKIAGFSGATFSRARANLKSNRIISIRQCYNNGPKEWHTILLQSSGKNRA